MKIGRALARLCLIAGLAVSASAAVAATDTEMDAIIRSLHPKSGDVNIANGLAELKIGSGFGYFDPTDATIYLTKVLGNPPSAVEGNLGVIFPTADDQQWFAVLGYSADGHVNDNDATKINYDELLESIKAGANEDAKQRRANGFPGIEIVGWAQEPFYDSVSKKLYWAKSIRFEGDNNLTLNYDIRILGREGFINVKIVDGLDQLKIINAQIPQILSMVNFTRNNTYGEYIESTDRTAAYGIAGLIAGGVLAKVGFFKALLVLAAAFWKVIAFAVVAFFAVIMGFIRKLFSSGKRDLLRGE
jgi:uncharacterized membrane-anchored protein